MNHVLVVTIHVDLDSGDFTASAVNPPVSGEGRTATEALARLTVALKRRRAQLDTTPPRSSGGLW